MKNVIADAVELSMLSAQSLENIASAAEMCADATFDFSKGCDLIAAELGGLKASGSLTFAAWESVRVQFEKVAGVRARDNGAADPAGAANDCWLRVVKRNAEIHGLTKPKAESPDADRMREKRAAEREQLLAAYVGQSAADLKSAQVEHYKTATPESIAKAKSLDKAIKLIEKAEREERKGAVGSLKSGASEAFKACLATLVERGDERGLGDLIVILKQFPDACAQRDAISVQ